MMVSNTATQKSVLSENRDPSFPIDFDPLITNLKAVSPCFVPSFYIASKFSNFEEIFFFFNDVIFLN